MPFLNRDILTITDFDRKDFEELFLNADKILEKKIRKINLLEGKIMASAFFEPSTRTRLSFEAAMKRLGGDVITLVGEEAISIKKGESFIDTVRMLDAYSDIIVIRHPYEGAAKLAAEIAESPVINGGDGKQHHPTQAFIDLYTVRKLKGGIDDLVYGVLGDLKYARTANSFLLALAKFRPRKIYLISPDILRVRPETKDYLTRHNINFEELRDVKDVIGELDILYVTRIQKERFPDPMEYERVKGSYKLTMSILENAKPTLKILHPLPKVDEISRDIDHTEYAAYFTQARFGVPVRMALLTLIFGKEIA